MTQLLSYENDEWHCARVSHSIGSQRFIYYEIQRLDANIGKVSFYATEHDQILSGIPHGVRLFDSGSTQCPQDGRQFTIIWWESYTLMYGSDIMCRLEAKRIQAFSLGSKSCTKEQMKLLALKKNSVPKVATTLPLANDDTAWRSIDQFLQQSTL